MDLRRSCYLILASTSPRRQDLLRSYGYAFEIQPSRATELVANFRNVRQRVLDNARLKGQEVLRRFTPMNRTDGATQVLLSADTLVVMDQKVYGKPEDMVQAHQFLAELGGKPHIVLTGVYLHLLETDVTHSFVEETGVTLRVLDHRQRTKLFARVSPLDKAAAYGYQDAPEIVTNLAGSRTNVFGLPMTRLERELRSLLFPTDNVVN